MTIRYIIFVLLITLGTGATAKEPDADPISITTSSGRDNLQYFNSMQEFLDSPSDKKALRRQLSDHCEGKPLLKCIDYLERNKHSLLSALPNNPDYWSAFHALIDGPALELELELELDHTIGGYNDPRKDTSKLIMAAYYWLYRAISEDRIHVTPDQFVLYYQSVRRQMSESSTLIDRMVFTAIVGIAHWQIEVLMALYAAEGDFVSVQTLAAALTPFSEQERSLRQTFHGEALYSQSMIENVELFKVEDFLHDPNVPVGTSSEMRNWVQQANRSFWDQTIESSGEITERNWSDYWGQGFSNLENELSHTTTTYFIDPPMFLPYIVTARSSEVLIYPLLALSDVYLGLSSPGLPARAPPPYWNWSWSEDPQQICLIPTHIAPNSADFSVERPACVTYLIDASN